MWPKKKTSIDINRTQINRLGSSCTSLLTTWLLEFTKHCPKDQRNIFSAYYYIHTYRWLTGSNMICRPHKQNMRVERQQRDDRNTLKIFWTYLVKVLHLKRQSRSEIQLHLNVVAEGLVLILQKPISKLSSLPLTYHFTGI